MRVDTFDQLKTPEIMAGEIMAGEAISRYTAATLNGDAFAVGEVRLIEKPIAAERADGSVDVQYRFEVGGETKE
jgi:hypothetical protein